MIRMAKYMDDDRDGKRAASKYQMTVVMEEISLFKKCHYFRAVLPFYRWNDIKAVWEDDATASMTTAVSFSLMMAWHRFPLPPHQRTLSPWTLVTGRAICYAVCVCVCVLRCVWWRRVTSGRRFHTSAPVKEFLWPLNPLQIGSLICNKWCQIADVCSETDSRSNKDLFSLHTNFW